MAWYEDVWNDGLRPIGQKVYDTAGSIASRVDKVTSNSDRLIDRGIDTATNLADAGLNLGNSLSSLLASNPYLILGGAAAVIILIKKV